ncbi:MAG: hypothetical protein LBF22_03620 [Deltaproteobacteria bacterium]|jgi:hypothetical protein|nr:hypothetical protein [Deltaproteobacteria bacterium]
MHKVTLFSHNYFLSLTLLAFLASTLVGCAPSYEFRAIPIRPMAAYPGHQSLPGANVGSIAYYDSQELTNLFGFDLKKAGVIPVQLLIENTGNNSIIVLPGSTLTDSSGLIWEVLPSDIVFQRLDNYTSGSISTEKGLQRTLTWGLAGAIVGAAVGIVAGESVGTAVGKGLAVGAAAGASSAVLGVGTQENSTGELVRDFSSRSLEHCSIPSGQQASGFLYFPGEAKQPRSLKLNLSVNGIPETLTLNL